MLYLCRLKYPNFKRYLVCTFVQSEQVQETRDTIVEKRISKVVKVGLEQIVIDDVIGTQRYLCYFEPMLTGKCKDDAIKKLHFQVSDGIGLERSAEVTDNCQ